MPGRRRIGRRDFLTATGIGLGVLALEGSLRTLASSATVTPSTSPYGPLSATPDANGLHLPAGFTSRIVARSGLPVVPAVPTSVWHTYPDGGATFVTADGGWIYVSNSEVPDGGGGASAIRFAADGSIVGAYPILTGTGSNCAGGPTPWGTWLSCEESDDGHVWECDPTGATPAIELPMLGTFAHEAAAVDPIGQAIYLTEDDGESRLYRFLPSSWPASRPDLRAGRLQAAIVAGNGTVTWKDVSPDAPDRSPETTRFARGEGAWHEGRHVYFATTSDNRVWDLDCRRQRLSVLFDGSALAGTPLTNVDNVTVHGPSGDLFVAEDPGNLELCVIASNLRRRRTVAPFARVAGSSESEITGPAFSPAGDRVYFSSQRGGIGTLAGLGVTYEVRGPFRGTSGASGTWSGTGTRRTPR